MYTLSRSPRLSSRLCIGICEDVVSFLIDSVRWKTRDDDGNFQLILEIYLHHNIIENARSEWLGVLCRMITVG